MTRKALLFLLLVLTIATGKAQQSETLAKLSPMLKSTVQHENRNSDRRIMTLLSFNKKTQSSSILSQYGCRVIDSIGHIFIVEMPCNAIGTVAADQRVKRIESEPMPRLAMDVTPGQINATDVYQGINLPHAYTGRGVAAGIFDNGFDFTHPAFIDSLGNSRACYYYDFCWQNDDGTTGHAITTPEEIAAYGHTHHANASLHGTHVMGIMAGNAVNGKYQGMAPEADIYAAHFNSWPADFDNPDSMTSAVCVLGFKYIFDQAEKDGKPCVINFSSGESFTINHQRILEGEALQLLTGPGRIIVTCAGNDGHRSAYIEKPENVTNAGAMIVNGIEGAHIIDLDIITPVNQRVYLGFLSLRLVNPTIEKTVSFPTDSVLSLTDTCLITTTVSAGDINLRMWKSDYNDPRGDVIHLHGVMPNPVYLMLYGAVIALSGDGPAWVYSDIKFSPFVNVNGTELYSYAQPGHSMWWPGTLPGMISVGATGYKSSFINIDGQVNNTVDDLAAQNVGEIALFSSRGPTFEGLTKPDVVAPGVSINAAFNSFVEQTESVRSTLTDQVEYNGKTYYYTAQSGTSMSTPVVAGSIALWLEANPELTPSDILEVIAATSSHPDESMEYPNNTYGYGQIDVYKGLLYILNTLSVIPTLSDHQPINARFHLNGRMLTVDIDSSEAQVATIIIYDLNGIKRAATQGTSINLSNLPAGVYAVQLITGNKTTTGSTLIRL